MAVTPQTNATIADLAGIIRECDDFVICGHVSPDGDCFGSQLALFHVLKAMGKRLSAMDDNTRKDAARMLDEEFGFSLGMTPEQAKAALQAKADALASTPVNLRMGENIITTSLAELGYTCTNLDIVDSLVPIGKSGNIVERYKEQKDLENNTVDYPLEFSVDLPRVENFVKNCSVYNTDPVEGELLIGSDGLP